MKDASEVVTIKSFYFSEEERIYFLQDLEQLIFCSEDSSLILDENLFEDKDIYETKWLLGQIALKASQLEEIHDSSTYSEYKFSHLQKIFQLTDDDDDEKNAKTLGKAIYNGRTDLLNIQKIKILCTNAQKHPQAKARYQSSSLPNQMQKLANLLSIIEKTHTLDSQLDNLILKVKDYHMDDENQAVKDLLNSLEKWLTQIKESGLYEKHKMVAKNLGYFAFNKYSEVTKRKLTIATMRILDKIATGTLDTTDIKNFQDEVASYKINNLKVWTDIILAVSMVISIALATSFCIMLFNNPSVMGIIAEVLIGVAMGYVGSVIPAGITLGTMHAVNKVWPDNKLGITLFADPLKDTSCALQEVINEPELLNEVNALNRVSF